ncbi:MAG: alanine--tRNA ligase [Halodesulfurarchaeum sp.]|nr:alanine--tRNA ligase [Halodesulfurarchaeum sp.]
MSDLEDAYRLEYFEEEGFVRTECTECGSFFWTRDHDRATCGEPPCDQYEFIDTPSLDTEYTLKDMREAFLSFFEERDHERVEPYPVAANRWRDDVLLTQVSIYDFQPLVTSGQTPPPANPLTISQPCIRMQDIDNVGKTGRHTMAFEMMAHHAFNAREDADEDLAYEGEVYWKDETVELCDEFFEEMGVDPAEITYIEDPWVGGGNAGPAFEVLYRGAELATLVFMSMEQDPEGEYELKDGNRYSPMDTYIVDTGYGLERWTWVSQGTPTVYEAVYPEMIAFLKEQAGIELSENEKDLIHRASKLSGRLDIDEAEDVGAARRTIAEELGVKVEYIDDLVSPLEDIYAIADHARTLAYMFGDGIVPSNVGTGYLARMVLRRTVRLVEAIEVETPIADLVDMQAERLGYEDRETVRDIVRSEVAKYEETLERGGRRVRQIAKERAETATPIPKSTLVNLYDSHGIQPDMVQEIAAEFDVEVEVPDNFYALVAQRHDTETTETARTSRDQRFADLPETEQLYYNDAYRTEFEAIVLDVFEREEGYDVVLDQTMFYPEGGGQPADHGTLSTDETTVDVKDVQIEDGVIRHHTDGDPGNGEFVTGKINTDRRRRLMRHHTATHVVIDAAREVLGDHVRQAGAQKGTSSSRIDIRHYERLDRKTVEEIEMRANETVMADLHVHQEWPDRHEAEETYGFDLYQGGIPAGQNIRLIHVGEDVQACGGTHVTRTGEIGSIKILSTERVQDGVERLTFAAGDAAVGHVQAMERSLQAAAETFDVTPSEVPETAERFFSEWKERGKQIEGLKQQLAEARAGGGEQADRIKFGDWEAVVNRLDVDMDELRATANVLADDGVVAILGSGVDGAQFVVSVPEGAPVNAGELVSELASQVGGGGGGPPDFAQGGGPEVDALDDALDTVPDLLTAAIEA